MLFQSFPTNEIFLGTKDLWFLGAEGNNMDEHVVIQLHIKITITESNSCDLFSFTDFLVKHNINPRKGLCDIKLQKDNLFPNMSGYNDWK